jgi:hypothetical protein
MDKYCSLRRFGLVYSDGLAPSFQDFILSVSGFYCVMRKSLGENIPVFPNWRHFLEFWG